MADQEGVSRPKVLVIDDEHLIANTLMIILNQSGFDTRFAYSAEDGAELLDSFQPEILLADVMLLPGMNGIELAIITRSKLPTCRILLFSGQAATGELLEKAHAEGHRFEVLAKPVHPDALIAKLLG